MSDFSQKTIESFFQDYGVTDADQKAKLLPLLTDVIYDYNLQVVNYEKEADAYRKKQIIEELAETEAKIKSIFEAGNQ
ncbi:MAG TPA: hypothetical protein PK619_01920 [bacterium]|nr:hypothetical protein [bacterium]HPN81042.1 hypothetical protein [bacterium]HPW39456.1 hypothetical protein [bacterium]